LKTNYHSKHYLAVEVQEYLVAEKYHALLGCTIDGKSYFNTEKKLNIFKIKLTMIQEAERILSRIIRITPSIKGGVISNAQQRQKMNTTMSIDVPRQLVLVTDTKGNHFVPFDYIDTVWKILRRSLRTEPRDVMTELANNLGFIQAGDASVSKTFYGDRGVYHQHYYWPLLVLRSLTLISQEGTGQLCITIEGTHYEDWKNKLNHVDSISQKNSLQHTTQDDFIPQNNLPTQQSTL